MLSESETLFIILGYVKKADYALTYKTTEDWYLGKAMKDLYKAIDAYERLVTFQKRKELESFSEKLNKKLKPSPEDLNSNGC